jgi:hypothetical protein
MIESYASALYGSGILDSAAATLERRLDADAENVETLNTLGQIYRKQGRLADAARVYTTLAALDPTDWRAAALRATLNGENALPYEGHDRLEPAPFAFITDFLPPALHQSLLPRVLAAPDENVVASKVGRDVYRPESRVSLTVEGLSEIQDEFWQHAVAALPSVFARLGVEPFTPRKKEVRVRTYREGHFFEIHRDNSIPESADRRVSFVYFFHRTPRRYTGGDLLFFDTNTLQNRYSGVTSFTRIEPTDNAIVFFPSRFYHAVIPVKCTSTDPGDTRFVVNGHVRVDGADRS